MSAKIIVLSADTAMKRALSEEFIKHKYSILADSPTIFDAPPRLAGEGAIVLVLDIDTFSIGPQTLQKMIEQYKLNTIIVGQRNIIQFLAMGIRIHIQKPPAGNIVSLKAFMRNVCIHIEEFIRIQRFKIPGDERISQIITAHDKVIAIAASTGGPDAVNTVIKGLPANTPPILIAQHMPAMLTHQFAQRLDRTGKMMVKEAAQTEYLQKNLAIVAPGDFHMRVVKRQNRLMVECFQGAKLHGVRPAADILFDSLADILGKNVIGVVLTGMGVDGARGLKNLKAKGAATIGQNEATSVVYGMPKAAYDLGAVDYQLPIDKIADKIAQLM
ncbi:MAG: CheB methylesterase domain-containing protein [Defluviitaleaceae bacterium]|nr:CheB methylesterase domain-containing protein [Defluviitaleaceae bacterium]